MGLSDIWVFEVFNILPGTVSAISNLQTEYHYAFDVFDLLPVTKVFLFLTFCFTYLGKVNLKVLDNMTERQRYTFSCFSMTVFNLSFWRCY
jgi:hypothetical protein